MKKLLPLLLALSALPTALYAAPADDAARISTLERRIADLEAALPCWSAINLRATAMCAKSSLSTAQAATRPMCAA